MKNFIEVTEGSKKVFVNIAAISYIRERSDGRGEITVLSISDSGKSSCITTKETYVDVISLISSAL